MILAGLAQAQTPPTWLSWLPFVLLFGMMWFLLIRPQQKQQARHRQLIESLKPGDRVFTTGGLLGTVVEVRDKIVTLRVAEKVKVEILRSAVTGLQSEAPKEPG